MKVQFHPASGRGLVRTFSIEERHGRLLVGVAAILLLLAVSLWVTVPAVVQRHLRDVEATALPRDLQAKKVEWTRLGELARSLRQRALSLGDLVNRIAFLYALSPAQWPKVLNPERFVLRSEDPEAAAAALDLYLGGLQRAQALIAEREKADPDLARRVPAVVPIASSIFEPSAFFGPRISPWTGKEEFFLGVDLATPDGSPVMASGAGTVAFAGTVRQALSGWFWQMGNVVVVSHGGSGATVYGHLSHVDVRRGQHVNRGDRLGSVGSTGWAIAPGLHYEYWRPEGETLRPTDPLFATLDRRLGRRPLSLDQMEATSAPGPFDPIPGIQIAAELAGRPAEKRAPSRERPRPRRRRI